MVPPNTNIQTISTQRLHPLTPYKTPTTTPLSLIDASVARYTPCGAIWYFSPSSKPPLTPEALRQSLTHTLSAYPQWTGQLRMTPYDPELKHTHRKSSQRYGRMEVRYGRGAEDPGVEFVVARTECAIEDAVPRDPTNLTTTGGIRNCNAMLREDALLPAIPLAGWKSHPEHNDPSVAVQITLFEGGGIAVGMQIAHSLADATSLATFVRDWSAVHGALALGNLTPDMHPVFEPWVLDGRAVGNVDDGVADGEVLERAFELPVHRYDWWASGAHEIPEVLGEERAARELARRGQKMPWGTWDVGAEVSHAVVHFTAEQLDRIWAAATARSDEADKTKASLSRHDALVAHIWTLINRSRGPENGNKDGKVHCDISLGLRKRVDPPLPPTSLGSPLQIAHTTLPWSVASSAEALPQIASSIKATLSRFTPGAVGALIYAIAHEMAPQRLWQAFLGREHTLVTSWVHTGLYECDFGTGEPPRYVHPIMPLVDGCVQVMEARPTGARTQGRKWYDDGVDVALYLEKQAMGRLVKDEHLWL